MRHEHEIPRFLGVNRGQFLANTLGESRVAAHENRDIGAQRQTQRSQPILVPAQLPKMIEAEQGCCSVRTAATDSTAHGQDFFNPDIDTERATGLLLKLFRGPDDQIAVVRNAFEFGVQANDTVIAHGESNFVAVVEKLKHRLQLVVAVFTATKNVQHQIEFGRRGQGQASSRHVIAPACAVARP
ncbi:hypothetical protein D3C86_1323580 [compost metagenome]